MMVITVILRIYAALEDLEALIGYFLNLLYFFSPTLLKYNWQIKLVEVDVVK